MKQLTGRCLKSNVFKNVILYTAKSINMINTQLICVSSEYDLGYREGYRTWLMIDDKKETHKLETKYEHKDLYTFLRIIYAR